MNISLKGYSKSESAYCQHAHSMGGATTHVLKIHQQLQEKRGNPTQKQGQQDRHLKNVNIVLIGPFKSNDLMDACVSCKRLQKQIRYCVQS